MKKITLSLFLAACALSACRNTDEPAAATRKVAIAPVITRATEVNFEAGDRIGLTIVKGVAAYADNSPLTFTGNLFAGELTWYDEAMESSTLMAYYPYDAAGTPASFTVATDQSGAGYGTSDLMAAVKSGVTPSASAVSMVFKHMLTKIVVDITNETGAEIAAVTLRNAVPTADFDLTTQSVTADSSAAAADIKTQSVTAGTSYRAIIIPQTAALTLAVELENGKALSQKLAETALAAGGQYTVKARVLPDGLEVKVSGEIENWDDKGELAGETGDEQAARFEDHAAENYFVYDGEQYRTVTLADGSRWMAEPLRYLPEGYTPSADAAERSHIWYPYALTGVTDKITAGGAQALTDKESLRQKGYLYDFCAAFGGVEITEENMYGFEGTQGICPEGWHIPTRTEYLALCGLSNRAAGESGNYTDESALFYDTAYGGGKYTLYNAAGWNYVLTGARMQPTDTASPAFQLTTFWSGNTTDETPAECTGGVPALTYIMSSTGYTKVAGGIQFFAQMTTFTKVYPEGRVSLSYININSGMQVRCVQNR